MFLSNKWNGKIFFLFCVFFVRISVFPSIINSHPADSIIISTSIDDLIERAFSTGSSVAVEADSLETDSLDPTSPGIEFLEAFSDSLIDISSIVPVEVQEMIYDTLDIQQVLEEYEARKIKPVIVPIDKRFLQTNPFLLIYCSMDFLRNLFILSNLLSDMLSLKCGVKIWFKVQPCWKMKLLMVLYNNWEIKRQEEWQLMLLIWLLLYRWTSGYFWFD